MEGLSRQLYDSIPQYARWIDEKEILLHICEAFQSEIDLIAEQIAARQYFFDTDIIPDSALPFIAQLVGAGTVGNKWLGIGMNPDWDSSHKRIFIQRVWTYWQIKGTPIGLREAFFLWLQFERTYSQEALKIVLPFGTKPTKHLPRWWNYNTQYGASEQQSLVEKQYFGGGEYDQSYIPMWEHKKTAQAFLRAEKQYTSGSRLGAKSPHIHVYPTVQEWNNIFPDIHQLLIEATPTDSRHTVIGWIPFAATTLDLERNDEFLTRQILLVDGIKYGEDTQGGTVLPIPLSGNVEVQGVATYIARNPVNLYNVFGLWSRRIILEARTETIKKEDADCDFNELFPGLADVLNPNKWFLDIEIETQEIFRLKPISCFFDRDTHKNKFILTDTNYLIIEFAFCPKITSSITKVSLYSLEDENSVSSGLYSPGLKFSKDTILGIKARLNLNTGMRSVGIILVPSRSEMIVVEDGGGITYLVFLKSPPTGTVTITSNLIDELIISPRVITFTDQDWDIPRTITVSAINRGLGYRVDQFRTITHSVIAEDIEYATTPTPEVDITIVTSSLVPDITVTLLGESSITEGGAGTSYSITLTAMPVSPVTINIAADTGLTLSTTSVIFTSQNWSSQTILVSAIDDYIYQETRVVTISHTVATTDVNYAEIPVDNVDITVINGSPAPDITVTLLGESSITEGGAGTSYSIALTAVPVSPVTINIAADTGLALSTTSVIFTSQNWSSQTILVSAIDDYIYQETRVVTISHTVSTTDVNYAEMPVDNVDITVINGSPAPDITVTLLGESSITEGGAGTSYSIALTAVPVSPVTINIAADTGLALSTTSVIFTSQNWSSQTILVSAIDDYIYQETRVVTISHTVSTTDVNYISFPVSSVNISVLDNDIPNLVLSRVSLEVTKYSLSDLYQVSLTTMPIDTVTVHLDASERLTLSISSISFTPSNWDAPVTVQVGVNTEIESSGNEFGVEEQIVHSVSGNDLAYTELVDKILPVVVTERVGFAGLISRISQVSTNRTSDNRLPSSMNATRPVFIPHFPSTEEGSEVILRNTETSIVRFDLPVVSDNLIGVLLQVNRNGTYETIFRSSFKSIYANAYSGYNHRLIGLYQSESGSIIDISISEVYYLEIAGLVVGSHDTLTPSSVNRNTSSCSSSPSEYTFSIIESKINTDPDTLPTPSIDQGLISTTNTEYTLLTRYNLLDTANLEDLIPEATISRNSGDSSISIYQLSTTTTSIQ